MQVVFVALSMALMPVAANANGNMVDTFTYNGNQSGFTPGTVYAMSVAGTALNVCEFSQAAGTEAPTLQYNASCFDMLAPNDSANYTAVAYLGTANNPSNYFAAGDGAGRIYLMQMQFNSNGMPTAVTASKPYTMYNVDYSNKPCGEITSLAVDPQGQFLYISCMQTAVPVQWSNEGSLAVGQIGVVLAVAPINSDGSLGTITPISPITPAGVKGYWGYATTPLAPPQKSNVTAVALTAKASNMPSSVNPKLRAYPPGYPALANTAYSSSGGVFFSGITSGFVNNIPINSGFMCSAGSCTVAYNITNNSSPSAFTAAEYGTNSSGNAVLYWNALPASLLISSTNTNSVVACQLTTLISATVTSTPCSAQTNLQWPPANVPSSTVWLDQFIFSPTPSAISNNTNFTEGLLQISAWNNGYLAFYDIAAGSNVPSVFFLGNGSNGEIGANVQGLSTDSNGNLLMQAGASGLLGYNAFPTNTTNIETQNDATYVPIPADPASNNCGGVCKVIQGLGIVASIITDIDVVSLDDDALPNPTRFALHAPVTKGVVQLAERPEQFSVSEPEARSADARNIDGSFQIAMNFGSAMLGGVFGNVQSDSVPTLFDLAKLSAEAPKVQCCDSNGNAPNPALANFLGEKPYWGSFTYSQKQMKLMGIRPGDKIQGMQLRLAEGISAQPKKNLQVKTLQIALKSGAAGTSDQAAWSYGSTVFGRSLNIRRCSYNRSVRDGYGPVIGFERNYRYLGGDLTITLRHSGSGNSKRFYLDAFGGTGVIGAYAQLSSVWSKPTNVTELKVAPTVKFIKKGSAPRDMEAASRCN